jgi:hypothetical protein
MQIRKIISSILILAFLITANNAYLYRNNIIRKSNFVNSSVLALSHTPDGQIKEETLEYVLVKLQSLTIEEQIKEIEKLQSFFHHMSNEFLQSVTGKELINQLNKVVFKIIEKKEHTEELKKILNIIKGNTILLQRILNQQNKNGRNVLTEVICARYLNDVNLIMNIMPDDSIGWTSGLKKRDPEDPIRIMGQPYLSSLSEFLNDRFKKPVAIYIFGPNEVTDTIIGFYIREKEDHAVIYTTRRTELLLTSTYWQLEKENPGKAKDIINKIFEFGSDNLEKKLNKSDVVDFFEKNKSLPDEFKLWVYPEFEYKPNQTLFNTILDEGRQILNMVYIAKRKAKDNLPEKAKIKLDKLSDQNKEELKKWKKDIKSNIDLMKKEFSKTFGYKILEFSKEWSYKELERLKKTFEEISGSKNSKYIKSIVREQDVLDEGAHYRLNTEQIVFGSRTDIQNIIHEFAHSLQYGAIPNLEKEWIECISQDHWFPSIYAITNWREDHAEAMVLYMTDPDKLKLVCPSRYEYLKNKFFVGKKYRDDVIEQNKNKSIESVVTEQNITLMNYFLKIGKISRQALKTKYKDLWVKNNNIYAYEYAAIAVIENISMDEAYNKIISNEISYDMIKNVNFKLLNITPPNEYIAVGSLNELKKYLNGLSKEEKIQALLNKDISNVRYNLLMQAAYNGNKEIVSFLLDEMQSQGVLQEIMNQKNREGKNVMSFVESLNKPDIMKIILEKKYMSTQMLKRHPILLLFSLMLYFFALCNIISVIVLGFVFQILMPVVIVVLAIAALSNTFWAYYLHPLSKNGQLQYRFLANLFLVGYIIDFYYAFSPMKKYSGTIKPQEKIKNSADQDESSVNAGSIEAEEMKEQRNTEDGAEQKQDIRKNEEDLPAKVKLIEKDKYDGIQINFKNGIIELKIKKQNEVDAGEKSLDIEIINGNSLFNPMELMEAIEKIGEKIKGRTCNQLKALSLVFGNIKLDLMPYIPNQEKAKDKIDMRFISSVVFSA